MKINEVIEKRRAYRSLESANITDEVIEDLANHARLAPSCYNNQPWRFIFVKSIAKLKKLYDFLPRGNSWAKKASMIVAVYTKKDFDCSIGEREYFLFDTGIAVAFMILRATEIGLVAHPIAGYKPEKIKESLGIPKDMNLITLIIVGKHSNKINDNLSEKQKQDESKRPQRKSFEEFVNIEI